MQIKFLGFDEQGRARIECIYTEMTSYGHRAVPRPSNADPRETTPAHMLHILKALWQALPNAEIEAKGNELLIPSDVFRGIGVNVHVALAFQNLGFRTDDFILVAQEIKAKLGGNKLWHSLLPLAGTTPVQPLPNLLFRSTPPQSQNHPATEHASLASMTTRDHSIITRVDAGVTLRPTDQTRDTYIASREPGYVPTRWHSFSADLRPLRAHSSKQRTINSSRKGLDALHGLLDLAQVKDPNRPIVVERLQAIARVKKMYGVTPNIDKVQDKKLAAIIQIARFITGKIKTGIIDFSAITIHRLIPAVGKTVAIPMGQRIDISDADPIACHVNGHGLFENYMIENIITNKETMAFSKQAVMYLAAILLIFDIRSEDIQSTYGGGYAVCKGEAFSYLIQLLQQYQPPMKTINPMEKIKLMLKEQNSQSSSEPSSTTSHDELYVYRNRLRIS